MQKIRAWDASAAGKPLAPMTIERREPGPRDVVLEILFCGVGHSDIHQARDEWSGGLFPMVPGHEIIGRVARLGRDVSQVQVLDGMISRAYRDGQRARIHQQGARCLGARCGSEAALHQAWQAERERLHRKFQRPLPRGVPQRELVQEPARRQDDIENWRKHYNEERPHSSLFGSTPSEYSARSRRRDVIGGRKRGRSRSIETGVSLWRPRLTPSSRPHAYGGQSGGCPGTSRCSDAHMSQIWPCSAGNPICTCTVQFVGSADAQLASQVPPPLNSGLVTWNRVQPAEHAAPNKSSNVKPKSPPTLS
jgi:hypothetical protein